MVRHLSDILARAVSGGTLLNSDLVATVLVVEGQASRMDRHLSLLHLRLVLVHLEVIGIDVELSLGGAERRHDGQGRDGEQAEKGAEFHGLLGGRRNRG